VFSFILDKVGVSESQSSGLSFLRKPTGGSACRTETGANEMEYLIAGLISLALCAYLLYALLRPEKF